MKGMVFLNSVVLLLQVNSVSGFRLELMYISLMENIRLNLTHVHGFQLLVQLPYFIEMDFFVFTKRIVIVAKGFLKMPNLHMLIKKKIPLLPRNLAFVTFGELLIVFYSMARRCCLLHLIKQNYLLKTFLRTLILMTQVSLYLLYMLYLISVIPKKVKKIIMNLDLSKASDPDFIPVVVLKNCEPEIS